MAVEPSAGGSALPAERGAGFLSLRFLYLTGSLTFFLWAGFTLLLAPVWGQAFVAMARRMVERADFLSAHGVAVSPSLEFFRKAGFTETCGVGVLYGFFFMSLPLAVVLGLLHGLAGAGLFQRWRSRLLWIGGGSLSALAIFVPQFWAYSRSVPWTAWGGLVCVGLPWLLVEALETLREIGARARRGQRLVTAAGCLFLFSPWFTHPAWHPALFPEEYRDVDRFTLIRDWLLLNPEGRGWVSEGYYAYSPYAAERDRVTVFQPPVVGVVGLPVEDWREKVRSLWILVKLEWRQFSQPVAFLKCKDLDQAERWLQEGKMDLLLLDHDDPRERALLERLGEREGAVFLTHGAAQEGRPFPPVYNPDSFFGAPHAWLHGQQVRGTPLTRRIAELRQRGYDERQNRIEAAARAWISQGVFSSPASSVLFLAVVLGGAACALFLLLSAIGGTIPWLALLLCVLAAPPSVAMLRDNFQVWEGIRATAASGHPLLQVLALHRQIKAPTAEAVRAILAAPLSRDKRVAMWQVELLGIGYADAKIKNDEGLRAGIRGYLQACSQAYAAQPLNFRYKFLQALVAIPELKDMARELTSRETHLYVRWYAESNGFL